MTRRQWMWLWIWLLLFFIIFCVWDKVRTLALVENTNPKIVTKEVKSEQKIVQPVVTTQHKDMHLKIVKEEQNVTLSGSFETQESYTELKEAYEKHFQVQEGTINIDKDVKNSKMMTLMPTLAEEFAQFKNGYLEYTDNNLIIEGIANDQNIIKSITDKALLSGDLFVDNRVILESIAEEPATAEINQEPVEADKEVTTTEPKSEQDMALLQAKLYALLNEQKVEFVYGKSKLTVKGQKSIDDVFKILEKHPDVLVEIGGHTDSDGKKVNNKILSQKRADAIKVYLVKKGLKMKNLKAVGYGESKPLVKNNSLANKQINRRVEFKIIGE
ncbi:MAG: OmpA family protein [Epsilonproteobacteria bacterium]|nr:OmpA family protein [Campylobacterota bacterium]